MAERVWGPPWVLGLLRRQCGRLRPLPTPGPGDARRSTHAPAGNGFTSKYDEALVHGCIPVVIMDIADSALSNVVDPAEVSGARGVCGGCGGVGMGEARVCRGGVGGRQEKGGHCGGGSPGAKLEVVAQAW